MDERPEVVVEISHLRHDQVFHYLPPGEMPGLELGARVLVPFGKKTVQGWVVGFSAPPPGVTLRPIESVVGDKPDFNPELLRLARWMADYYLHPLPEILKLMSPPEKPVRTRKHAPAEGMTPAGRHGRLALNAEQVVALREIEAALRVGGNNSGRALASGGAGSAPGAGRQEAAATGMASYSSAERQPGATGAGRQFLLHGITGSGKTEVYLRAAMTALSLGRQVLYLVPEIALTPQAVAWFRAALGDQVAVWHSRLSRGERYETWSGIRQGVLSILIGPRSAVFAPFKNLGLIIVDEEQDASYKQQESPYYHARQVAVRRARGNGAVLILGSATPSLESYTGARDGRYRLLRLTRRPQGRRLPRVTVIDLRQEHDVRFNLLGQYLSGQIALRLQRREQVILFLNRRGYSPIVFCPSCGLVLKCERCSISLVYHRTTGDLRCHYCNSRRPLPERCPGCGTAGSLRYLGTGIQRVEHLLRRFYPQARIQRLDFDTTRRKGEFDRILDSFGKQETDILIGTQMVAKGHDFPGVTLVGVLDADLALKLPDYRATERTYQLLAQVAGRAGRGRVPGEVVVQTYFPDHYSIQAACFAGYPSFYRQEIRNRELSGYPPCGELIRIRVAGEREQQVERRINELAEALVALLPGERVRLLGPAPAPVLRLQDLYRWQVMLMGELGGLKSEIRDCIQRFKKNTSVIISIEVDPYGL
ncbi:MAG: primosomal protein N' [Thermacetogeniaceae bacterium]|jgi:primosomal protein N' (replication factor Y)